MHCCNLCVCTLLVWVYDCVRLVHECVLISKFKYCSLHENGLKRELHKFIAIVYVFKKYLNNTLCIFYYMVNLIKCMSTLSHTVN